MKPVLDKTAIAALIPHDGAMALLDGVLAWDRGSIACTASSHRAAGHPLATGGGLDGLCGIEYAAQAMAVHGCLAGGGSRPAAGYLASLRDVVCSVARLDCLESDLLVTAELLIADVARVIYSFEITTNGAAVLSGRAAVIIDTGPSEPAS